MSLISEVEGPHSFTNVWRGFIVITYKSGSLCSFWGRLPHSPQWSPCSPTLLSPICHSLCCQELNVYLQTWHFLVLQSLMISHCLGPWALSWQWSPQATGPGLFFKPCSPLYPTSLTLLYGLAQTLTHYVQYYPAYPLFPFFPYCSCFHLVRSTKLSRATPTVSSLMTVVISQWIRRDFSCSVVVVLCPSLSLLGLSQPV